MSFFTHGPTFQTPSKWWILLPPILGILAALLLYVFQSVNGLLPRSLLAFNAEVFQLTVPASVQAIGFCFLMRKSRENSWLSSALATALDISGYWDNQRLARQLHDQIDKAWKHSLDNGEKLAYFVGVEKTGTVFGYEPMSPAATEKSQLTPLPSLAANSEAEAPPALAKFRVTFTPTGSVIISSYRGIPLSLITGVMYVGILGISKLLGLVEVATNRVISF